MNPQHSTILQRTPSLTHYMTDCHIYTGSKDSQPADAKIHGHMAWDKSAEDIMRDARHTFARCCG